jgi:hypothetical protein
MEIKTIIHGFTGRLPCANDFALSALVFNGALNTIAWPALEPWKGWNFHRGCCPE